MVSYLYIFPLGSSGSSLKAPQCFLELGIHLVVSGEASLERSLGPAVSEYGSSASPVSRMIVMSFTDWCFQPEDLLLSTVTKPTDLIQTSVNWSKDRHPEAWRGGSQCEDGLDPQESTHMY